MRKSSRFWWLHSAVLLSAVIGCKNCGGGSCGGPGSSGPPPMGGTAAGGPVGSAGATLYSQSTPPGYPSSQSYPGGSMSSSSSFPSGANAGYPMPNMSSSIPQGLGGTR